jgi:hypothetical protein
MEIFENLELILQLQYWSHGEKLGKETQLYASNL